MATYIGRGGWTWYTGSAGWLYRAGLEAILGFQLQGEQLLLSPCIPKSWPGYDIVYRHRGIVVMELDSVAQANSTNDSARIALRNDGGTHCVRIVLG